MTINKIFFFILISLGCIGYLLFLLTGHPLAFAVFVFDIAYAAFILPDAFIESS